MKNNIKRIAQSLEDYINENKKIFNKYEDLINDVVTFRTLPPQIDYVLPYKKKANKAIEKIEKLPKKEQNIIFKEIDKRVDDYYDSPAAELDAKF